jgi:hypothetical protein
MAKLGNGDVLGTLGSALLLRRTTECFGFKPMNLSFEVNAKSQKSGNAGSHPNSLMMLRRL